MNLLDTFRIDGTDYEEFKKANKMMADEVKYLRVNTRDITVLSHCSLPQYKENPDKDMFYALMPEILDRVCNGKNIQLGYISKADVSSQKSAYMDETEKNTGVVLSINKEKYLVSKRALTKLCANIGVTGDQTVNHNGLFRDMHIADVLSHINQNLGIVYKEDDGVKKIFTVTGKYYTVIPQTIVTDIADAIISEELLGPANVMSWQITHGYTELILTFPKAAEDFADTYGIKGVIPGILICTSDTGESSVITKGVYFKGSSYVITDEMYAKHMPSSDCESILERTDKEIFANIRKLPEALMELIGIPAPSYSELPDFLENLIKKEFGSSLTLKKKKEFLAAVLAEFNPSISYTMYDIATAFMSIPERITGAHKTTIDSIRKVCGKIPFSLVKKSEIDSEEEEEEFILL